MHVRTRYTVWAPTRDEVYRSVLLTVYDSDWRLDDSARTPGLLAELVGKLPSWARMNVSSAVFRSAHGAADQVERIVWWGRVWNGTSIMAAAVAPLSLICFPFWAFGARERRRIRRGLCTRCAYQVQTAAGALSMCPECGQAVPAHKM
ncbi:MAG TPA: hypothetical protein VD971_04425 [Phycisphaerales bacterium]|nr:hypothetical protein [Phycisphaerales bacterium]